jgi:hypothetical protein
LNGILYGIELLRNLRRRHGGLYDSGDGEKICPAYAGSLRKSAARELLE